MNPASKNDRRAKLVSGFTIVELLIAATVLTILLGMTTAYFAGSARITKRNQAHNDVESKLRSVAEIVAQDLEIAGSKVTFDAVNSVTAQVDTYCSAGNQAADINCVIEPTTAGDKLIVHYATSLRPAAPCRRIDYRLSGTTLQRVEQSASGVNCRDLSTATPSAAAFSNSALSENITAFNISYFCADGRTSTNPKTCYGPHPTSGLNSFPRQADITVQGRSDALADVTGSVTLTATTPNLKR